MCDSKVHKILLTTKEHVLYSSSPLWVFNVFELKDAFALHERAYPPFYGSQKNTSLPHKFGVHLFVSADYIFDTMRALLQ